MSGATGWLLRSEQAYCLQLCEKDTLDFGIAYSNAELRDVPEANQFREVLVENSADIPSAFGQGEAWFRDRGLTCWRWAPAGGVASAELADFLTKNGFIEKKLTCLSLARWVDFSASSESIRILPARAMRAAFKSTLVQPETNRACVSAKRREQVYDLRMDDAQLEMFVALINNQPAGRCGLYQVGDIARVMDLTVLPGLPWEAVMRALLSHTLAMAKRLAMRQICTAIEGSDAVRLGLFGAAGFEPAGTISEFDRLPNQSAT